MRILPLIQLFIICTAGIANAQSRVSDATSLLSTLDSARGAEDVLLAPGDYGSVRITRLGAGWSAPVTLRSADPDHPAVFQNLVIDNSANIVITGVIFDYVYKPGDPPMTSTVTIKKSSSITIANSHFDGDNASGTGTVSDGAPTGRGLTVLGSADITLQGNLFTTWFKSSIFGGTSNLRIAGNEVCDSRSEGFNFAAVRDVLVEANYIHDFRKAKGSKDHPDMIQFWTKGTKEPTVNVTIRDNFLDQGAGDWTQSLFMRNEEVDQGRAGDEMLYRNIQISGNVIRNSHLHGISVGDSDGVEIASNTLLQATELDSRNKVWRPSIGVSKSSRNVTIENNVSPAIRTVQPTGTDTWHVSGNQEIQADSPAGADYYGKTFRNWPPHHPLQIADLEFLEESKIGKSGAGSHLNRKINDLMKVVQVRPAPGKCPSKHADQ